MAKFVAVLFLVVAFTLPSRDAQSAEKNLIFNPPGSFLGSTPTNQTDYLSGVLDAFFQLQNEGPLEPYVVECLFGDGDVLGTLVSLRLFAVGAVRDAEIRIGENFSVVSAVVEGLKTECAKGGVFNLK